MTDREAFESNYRRVAASWKLPSVRFQDTVDYEPVDPETVIAAEHLARLAELHRKQWEERYLGSWEAAL